MRQTLWALGLVATLALSGCQDSTLGNGGGTGRMQSEEVDTAHTDFNGKFDTDDDGRHGQAQQRAGQPDAGEAGRDRRPVLPPPAPAKTDTTVDSGP